MSRKELQDVQLAKWKRLDEAVRSNAGGGPTVGNGGGGYSWKAESCYHGANQYGSHKSTLMLYSHCFFIDGII